jgi:hypothetical protein
MRDDPAGHYAALDLHPAASAEAVQAAYRAAARRYHPDVPGTGDAARFIRVRAAYEVLSDPLRRAAYDRMARAAQDAPPPPPWAVERPATPWVWPRGRMLGLAAGCAGFALLALVLGTQHVGPSPPPPARPRPKPVTAAASPAAPPVAPTRRYDGPAEAYVLPSGEAAMLWRREQERLVPAGTLSPFTPLRIQGILPEHGMAEVTTGSGRHGLVALARLAPGDGAVAERARCIFAAGPPPANAELLARRAEGEARVLFENRRDQPAVVKLREPSGEAVAEVFVAPRSAALVERLPPGLYRPDYAFGELWSRGCSRFMAGMRAERFGDFEQFDARGPRFVISRDDGEAEPDEAFDRE